MPEFPPTLLPQLLAMETSSRASNAEYLTFYNKNPLLIDRLRFVRESYKDIFTELLLADDTRVGFHRQDNGLLVWQGAYLTRSAETLLSWRAVANALNDLIEQHELIAAIDPKKLPQVEEQLSFELPDGSPPSAENNRLEKDDFLTPEKQETVIRSALPVAEYNAPQMDDGSVITDEEVNWALAAGSNFENSKFRIYQQFTTTQGDHAAFLKKEYGSGGRSWDYQSGANGWVDHGPAGLKLILTNEEDRFERRLPWRAAAKHISGRIAQQLYQKAKIQICGYEKADLPDSFFDLAIGNVPFGQYQVTDRQYDKLHFQIHDYFLAKTVDKLRVGGIMAFITTSGTMDKKSESVRRYLAARCDLVGAVRLPNNTFTAQAGTTVTSDILFLQKRGRVLEQDAPWIHVGETADGIPLNRYFIDHPEMICGKMQLVSGPYGQRPTCAPLENGTPLEGQLDAALANLQAEYALWVHSQ